jgi:dihydroxyacid dehydratase/phosphogluconate dehydratase
MTIPAIGMAFANVPEAKAAWDKIDSNNLVESIKKLTPQDYHALSSVLIGLLSGKNYLRGNLAERAVLKHSGVNTESKSKIREYSNKFGITRTKP